MTDATHTTVITMRRDLALEAQQHAAFSSALQRGFSDTPGFVAGLWTFDREASEIIIVTTFDSLAAAQSFAEIARANADRQTALGLEFVSVRVTEVLAAATA
jgi:hypothetical protein